LLKSLQNHGYLELFLSIPYFIFKIRKKAVDSIQLPTSEYEEMKEKLAILQDSKLLEKVNKLVDLLFQEKYGLYLGDYTEDLKEASLNQSWPESKSCWDEV
jgi:hypothetical protein